MTDPAKQRLIDLIRAAYHHLPPVLMAEELAKAQKPDSVYLRILAWHDAEMRDAGNRPPTGRRDQEGRSMSDPTNTRMVEMLRAMWPQMRPVSIERLIEGSNTITVDKEDARRLLAWSDQREAAAEKRGADEAAARDSDRARDETWLEAAQIVADNWEMPRVADKFRQRVKTREEWNKQGWHPAPHYGWSCFHCGETFLSVGAAQLHFGANPRVPPACALTTLLAAERAPLEAQLASVYEIYHAEVRRSEALDQQIGEARERALEDVLAIAQGWLKSDYDESCNAMCQSIIDEIRALKAGAKEPHQ
jgi:hypothetical protein